jgi:hypothetical protein
MFLRNFGTCVPNYIALLSMFGHVVTHLTFNQEVLGSNSSRCIEYPVSRGSTPSQRMPAQHFDTGYDCFRPRSVY